MKINQVSRLTGLPVRTIRFYEDRGIVQPQRQADSHYRDFSRDDIRRLKLARNARRLGLSVDQVAAFVNQAFASPCAQYLRDTTVLIERQRQVIAEQIAQLHEADRELAALADHVQHSCSSTDDDCSVSGCDYCPLIESIEEGGTCCG